MSRAPGLNPPLVLPPPPEKYDAADQRQTRRLIESSARQLPKWSTVGEVPAPLDALASLSGVADNVPYFTGVSTMALAALTPYARTIIACANAAAMRSALGLGALAVFSTVDETLMTLFDVTTQNVTSAKHGFTPKSPADATKFLNGAATPVFAQVKDSDLSLSDITTGNVSTARHGFAPKLPNDATKYLDGTGAFSTPAGGGGVDSPTLTDTSFLAAWWKADAADNTYDASAVKRITRWTDQSGNARHISTVGGYGERLKTYVNGNAAVVTDPTNGVYYNNLQLPIEGSMTFFMLARVRLTSTYQNFWEYLGANPAVIGTPNMNLFYDQPSNALQISTTLASSSTTSVIGAWAAIVIHFYNSGSNNRYTLRVNGAQRTDQQGASAGVLIPGSLGTPSSMWFSIGNRITGQLPVKSDILEWGFYSRSKAGSEAQLESYLRQRAVNW